jgi:hypothetical protein
VESGVPSPGPRDAGGLIVMVRTNPSRAARALADDLHAPLALGGQATAEALDRFLAPAPPVPPPDLDQLAASMRRAEVIREQTRAATAERLATSFNTRLAIHPDTVRRAAAELLDARAACSATERRVRRRHLRARCSVPVAVVVAIAASVAGGVLGAAWLGLVIGAGALVLGAAAAVGWRIVQGRRESVDPIAAAHQAVGFAERRWVQVTGPDADPADIENLIRRYEPQHRLVADLVAESPAVRAADQLAVARRAAWVAAWRAAVGDDAPLADPQLARLLRRDETELWLDTEGVPTPGPPTLVVADPFAGLVDTAARDLHQRLSHLPAGHRVVVVLEPDPGHPTGARLPTFERAEADITT